jgi:predicted ATPase
MTGGPGAGKSVVSASLARLHPDRLTLVPEAATQVYAALGTRWDLLDIRGRRDVQRRIYRLQVEQEERLSREHPGKLLLLDRGTIDGAAYWPDGPDAYWTDLGTTAEAELSRYDRVLWLQTAAAIGIYDGDGSNFCRFEDAKAAVASGELLACLWASHPSLTRINAFGTVAEKVAAVERALEL